ncbi:MAG TPA: glycoside hydrolase family 3 protein [Chloroflexia bacterium]|nr:glycoside hydrolase family 3 protein [Chloroflexia bacterium]
MNLREKLGQRFLYRLPGVTQLTQEVADFLVECRAGGVVLFGYNVQTPEQVAKLNHDLQALAARHNMPPFIIGVDEEGGQVSRMPAEGRELILPSQMALGVAGAEAVRACAEVNARRLRSLGFNLNFAPVLDINNNPANPVIGTRSFGDDPALVAELGGVALEAYLQTGISPCAKHFPGHGDTNVDSHFHLPVVNKSLEELRRFELVPFQRAIAAGIPAIMTAHILYPQFETGGLPATLSPRFLTQVLRQELGFEGLIFTDALDMAAIADRYRLGEASLMAFQAGADIVMSFSLSFDEQYAAFEEVVAAAEAGELDLLHNAETDERITGWRKRFCTGTPVAGVTEEDVQIIAGAAQHSLSLVCPEKDFVPLSKIKAQRPLLVDFTAAMESPVEEGRQPGPLLETELRATMPALLRLEVPANPTPADELRALSWASQSDLLIIVTRHATRYEEQAKLVRTLIENYGSATPLFIIAAREPYDLALFEGSAGSIATYGDPPATIKALANLLTVEQPILC